MTAQFDTIDNYIRTRPAAVQPILDQVRWSIHRAAPGAGERISYQMPTVTLNGRDLVHFAAWKQHIAMYAAPVADETIERELAPYRAARGTLRFPLAKPVPYELIRRLVALRVRQQGDN